MTAVASLGREPSQARQKLASWIHGWKNACSLFADRVGYDYDWSKRSEYTPSQKKCSTAGAVQECKYNIYITIKSSFSSIIVWLDYCIFSIF